MTQLENHFEDNVNSEKQWKGIYTLGGIATLVVLAGSLLDAVVGSIRGGNLSAIPQTAIGRFAQFQDNWLLGLFNLDLLNVINQIVMIPAFFALYEAHRKVKGAYAALALVVFLVGTTIFVTTNTALPMLELSRQFAASTAEFQKTMLAAAGEAMLARGAHGSPGVFIGFMLPNMAGFIMSLVMLSGKIFGKVTSYFGIAGSALIAIYIILVTFVPGVKNMAMAFAMPAGLLLMGWMILFAVRLFRLGRPEHG